MTIVTSVCVQVPSDTERPPGRPEFHLARVISAEDSAIVHVMYLRRCCRRLLQSLPLARHFSRDCPRARTVTGQPGGPRKLVLGMASAMGNNRGVSIPPSFPSLGGSGCSQD